MASAAAWGNASPYTLFVEADDAALVDHMRSLPSLADKCEVVNIRHLHTVPDFLRFAPTLYLRDTNQQVAGDHIRPFLQHLDKFLRKQQPFQSMQLNTQRGGVFSRTRFGGSGLSAHTTRLPWNPETKPGESSGGALTRKSKLTGSDISALIKAQEAEEAKQFARFRAPQGTRGIVVKDGGDEEKARKRRP